MAYERIFTILIDFLYIHLYSFWAAKPGYPLYLLWFRYPDRYRGGTTKGYRFYPCRKLLRNESPKIENSNYLFAFIRHFSPQSISF